MINTLSDSIPRQRIKVHLLFRSSLGYQTLASSALPGTKGIKAISIILRVVESGKSGSGFHIKSLIFCSFLYFIFDQASCIDACTTKWMNLNQRQMAVFMEVGPLADKKMGQSAGQGM